MCYWRRYSEQGSPVAGGGRDGVNAQALESDPERGMQSPERTVPVPGNPSKKANLTFPGRADSIRN